MSKDAAVKQIYAKDLLDYMIKVTMMKKGLTAKRGTPVQGFKPPRKSTSALWLSK